MGRLKKYLVLLVIIVCSAFTFAELPQAPNTVITENPDKKVTTVEAPKNREHAEMNITINKLIPKEIEGIELPTGEVLLFIEKDGMIQGRKKRENILYVTDSLDSFPDLSTVNGKTTIANIQKIKDKVASNGIVVNEYDGLVVVEDGQKHSELFVGIVEKLSGETSKVWEIKRKKAKELDGGSDGSRVVFQLNDEQLKEFTQPNIKLVAGIRYEQVITNPGARLRTFDGKASHEVLESKIDVEKKALILDVEGKQLATNMGLVVLDGDKLKDVYVGKISKNLNSSTEYVYEVDLYELPNSVGTYVLAVPNYTGTTLWTHIEGIGYNSPDSLVGSKYSKKLTFDKKVYTGEFKVTVDGEVFTKQTDKYTGSQFNQTFSNGIRSIKFLESRLDSQKSTVYTPAIAIGNYINIPNGKDYNIVIEATRLDGGVDKEILILRMKPYRIRKGKIKYSGFFEVGKEYTFDANGQPNSDSVSVKSQIIEGEYITKKSGNDKVYDGSIFPENKFPVVSSPNISESGYEDDKIKLNLSGNEMKILLKKDLKNFSSKFKGIGKWEYKISSLTGAQIMGEWEIEVEQNYFGEDIVIEYQNLSKYIETNNFVGINSQGHYYSGTNNQDKTFITNYGNLYSKNNNKIFSESVFTDPNEWKIELNGTPMSKNNNVYSGVLDFMGYNGNEKFQITFFNEERVGWYPAFKIGSYFNLPTPKEIEVKVYPKLKESGVLVDKPQIIKIKFPIHKIKKGKIVVEGDIVNEMEYSYTLSYPNISITTQGDPLDINVIRNMFGKDGKPLLPSQYSIDSYFNLKTEGFDFINRNGEFSFIKTGFNEEYKLEFFSGNISNFENRKSYGTILSHYEIEIKHRKKKYTSNLYYDNGNAVIVQGESMADRPYGWNVVHVKPNSESTATVITMDDNHQQGSSSIKNQQFKALKVSGETSSLKNTDLGKPIRITVGNQTIDTTLSETGYVMGTKIFSLNGLKVRLKYNELNYQYGGLIFAFSDWDKDSKNFEIKVEFGDRINIYKVNIPEFSGKVYYNEKISQTPPTNVNYDTQTLEGDFIREHTGRAEIKFEVGTKDYDIRILGKDNKDRANLKLKIPKTVTLKVRDDLGEEREVKYAVNIFKVHSGLRDEDADNYYISPSNQGIVPINSSVSATLTLENMFRDAGISWNSITGTNLNLVSIGTTTQTEDKYTTIIDNVNLKMKLANFNEIIDVSNLSIGEKKYSTNGYYGLIQEENKVILKDGNNIIFEKSFKDLTTTSEIIEEAGVKIKYNYGSSTDINRNKFEFEKTERKNYNKTLRLEIKTSTGLLLYYIDFNIINKQSDFEIIDGYGKLDFGDFFPGDIKQAADTIKFKNPENANIKIELKEKSIDMNKLGVTTPTADQKIQVRKLEAYDLNTKNPDENHFKIKGEAVTTPTTEVGKYKGVAEVIIIIIP